MKNKIKFAMVIVLLVLVLVSSVFAAISSVETEPTTTDSKTTNDSSEEPAEPVTKSSRVVSGELEIDDGFVVPEDIPETETTESASESEETETEEETSTTPLYGKFNAGEVLNRVKLSSVGRRDGERSAQMTLVFNNIPESEYAKLSELSDGSYVELGRIFALKVSFDDYEEAEYWYQKIKNSEGNTKQYFEFTTTTCFDRSTHYECDLDLRSGVETRDYLGFVELFNI